MWHCKYFDRKKIVLTGNIDISNLTSRHVARLIAVLGLYSYEMQQNYSEHHLRKIVENVKTAYCSGDIFELTQEELSLSFYSPDNELLRDLIDLSLAKKDDIEAFIGSHLIDKYSLDKIDKVISAILKLAALEILYCGDTATKIIIDEYVSLTRAFYDSNEVGFVNKVVDLMAHSARKEKLISE
jgi:transcription antitermination protein NusB